MQCVNLNGRMSFFELIVDILMGELLALLLSNVKKLPTMYQVYDAYHFINHIRNVYCPYIFPLLLVDQINSKLSRCVVYIVLWNFLLIVLLH